MYHYPTTADDVKADIETMGADIAKAIKMQRSAETLAELVNRLAVLEGHYIATLTFEKMAVDGRYSTADRREALIDLLTSGADDRWSGRKNDVKRARFDGIREAAGRLLQKLEI